MEEGKIAEKAFPFLGKEEGILKGGLKWNAVQ